MIQPLRGWFPDFRSEGEDAVTLASVRLLAPVVPSKIIAVGPNYRAHLKGSPAPDRPYFWLKPPTTVNNPGDPISIPQGIEGGVPAINHESELAIVIGRTTRRVTPGDAPKHIFGYTCINDVTAGAITEPAVFAQSKFFVDGKIYDGFAPLGPAIETEADPKDLQIRCIVNGEVRQDHRTSDMIFSCADLVSMISMVMTLHPGDVIATGSPPGPGPLYAGDVVTIGIERIGELCNPVVAGG